VVKFLLEHIREKEVSLREQDIHGNTPLHYLVSYRRTNDNLLQELREIASSGDEDKSYWSGIRNHWGFTIGDLYLNNRTARRDWDKEYMPFWRET